MVLSTGYPFQHPLLFEDDSTWLFTGPPPDAHAPPPPHPAGDVEIPDAPVSPPRFHASTSRATVSYPPPIADPSIQDVYRLVYDMRQEQGDILRDLQFRVGAIEDEMREWRLDPSDD